MNNLIKKIVKGEEIDLILQKVINNIFRNGPVKISDLEIITYLTIYQPEIINQNINSILNFMGIFYKNTTTNSLEEVVFGQYHRYLFDEFKHNYTPVQAKISHDINNNKCYSFSAPTSTGKSYVFINKILESKNDVVIVVPSRALINEYLNKLHIKIEDKSINILPFIDKINTKHCRRNIFIVTPERCRELFKLKNEFNIELFLFDEAQLSNEESTRGLFFDGIVRRCYNHFPNAAFIFAHPFVKNPEAQIIKNNLQLESNSKQFVQKNVGQIFFTHDKKKQVFSHFGIEKEIMGNNRIECNFDPIANTLQNNGSVLFYVSKKSIRDNRIFREFEYYINLCEDYSEEVINDYIIELSEYTGGTTQRNKDHYSKLITYLKKGIVIHHGSLPLKIRSILEKYTNEGLCRICFATSTLEQGVNMPFDIVYLNRLDGSKPLSVKNLIGRAGRSTVNYKFDYGFVIIQANSLSFFRNIMLRDEVLEEVSLLDVVEDDKDSDYNDFKDAILNDTFSDEYNLTENQLNKLVTEDVFVVIKQLLNLIFINNEIIPLSTVNNDIANRLLVYEKFQTIYSIYLGRNLEKAEEYILNTAIKIILWRIHGKTFKNICWYRYSYASQSNIRNRYKRAPEFISGLEARYFTEFSEIPNKNLRAYNGLENVLAKDVDYDYIISDTYDFIDKLIGFKLSDIYFAAFTRFYDTTNDERALRLAKFIKYGTDSDRFILMLRYGLTFEDIEILDSYISYISTEEIIFNDNIFDLEDRLLEPIKRYI